MVSLGYVVDPALGTRPAQGAVVEALELPAELRLGLMVPLAERAHPGRAGPAAGGGGTSAAATGAILAAVGLRAAFFGAFRRATGFLAAAFAAGFFWATVVCFRDPGRGGLRAFGLRAFLGAGLRASPAFAARRASRYCLIFAFETSLCSPQTMPNTGAAGFLQPGTGQYWVGGFFRGFEGPSSSEEDEGRPGLRPPRAPSTAARASSMACLSTRAASWVAKVSTSWRTSLMERQIYHVNISGRRRRRSVIGSTVSERYARTSLRTPSGTVGRGVAGTSISADNYPVRSCG